jgi:2-dehydro-3-deoxyphosphooctonate aldolase (KDO 8-P synthase)
MEMKRIETISLPAREFRVPSPRGPDIAVGKGHGLALIAGPCVIDSKELIYETAQALAEISQRLGVGLIFKSSFEKDNRGSEKNWRGPMAIDGLKILANVRKEFGLPVLTDIHRIEDVAMVAEHVDVLQIPAYMCQQTSLVIACGETGRPINVKKGQFLAPENMNGAVSKIRSTGNKNVLLTERGACFGYNRLVADMRSIPVMQELGAPVCFDATPVIPQAERKPILPDDIRIETSKSSGPGGQNVNKRETAVRIVHIPTNIAVHVATEREQERNKQKALEILSAKLFKLEEDKRKAEIEGRQISKTMEIEWGNQIRSYVLHPYKMVKDHRTDVETSNVEAVLERGELDAFIEAEKTL